MLQGLNEGDIVQFKAAVTGANGKAALDDIGIVVQASFTFFDVLVGDPRKQQVVTVWIEDSKRLIDIRRPALRTDDTPRRYWDLNWQAFTSPDSFTEGN